MSTKYFCDICGDEINESNSTKGGFGNGMLAVNTLKGGKNLRFEIFQYKDNSANDGDFCKYCVLDELMALDDRGAVTEDPIIADEPA